MALIKCPSCNSEISDKANNCPKCGFNMIEYNKSSISVCEECKKEIPQGSNACPHCGCPVVLNNNINPQQVEVVSVNVSKSHKKTIIIIIATVLIICGGVLTANVIHDKQEQTKIEQMAKEEKEKTEQIESDYYEYINQISVVMLSGAADAESAGTLIHDVWYDTIYEENNTSTRKYTHNNFGDFNSDFNVSLSNLFADDSFINTIDKIEVNQDKVKGIMKKLTNPPDKYKEAYSALKDYYDAYLELTNIVINPTGSLSSYTESFNQSDSDVSKYYKAIDVFLS